MRTDLGPAVMERVALRETLLREFVVDDDQALNDTLAGLDNFEERCLAVLRYSIEQEAHAEALGALIKQMQSRKARLEMAAQRARDAVFSAMQAAELPRIVAPDMTVSIGKGRPKVIVTDAELIPERFRRVKTEPNLTLIYAAASEGREVPGATLSNPIPTLMVRRS